MSKYSFCLNYYPNQKYLQEADQLKIKYRRADRTLEDFLKFYNDKTIIIDVSGAFEEQDASLLKGLYDKYKNIKIIFNFYNQEHLSRAKQYKIPFFFINHVTSIDQLYGFIEENPTDLYICEELGFFLNKISHILHDKNIKVRIFPNICQSSFSKTQSLKTFFVRPEDIPIYGVFVDVFELVADEDRQKIVFKIYKQNKWFGKLEEIIPTFKGSVDNRYILDTFGAVRSGCGKRCLYKPGSCSICERYIQTAETFKQNKIVIQRAKKKN